MQTRPDASTLLDAVGAFLLTEVAPKLEGDKALQFRLLIAANLCAIVSAEEKSFDARLSGEARRLRALLEGSTEVDAQLDSPERATRLLGLQQLQRNFAAQLREGTLLQRQRAAVLEHLKATARETLAVTNPRFELDEEL